MKQVLEALKNKIFKKNQEYLVYYIDGKFCKIKLY